MGCWWKGNSDSQYINNEIQLEETSPQKYEITQFINKGYGADSVSMTDWPRILAERSAGGRLSLPWQEVLSPLVEGGVWVVKGGCEMIKKKNEEKHHFWIG